jgi:hypothetical protein
VRCRAECRIGQCRHHRECRQAVGRRSHEVADVLRCTALLSFEACSRRSSLKE